MAPSAQSSSPAIIGSSAYEWDEEFFEGQPQTYESQNTRYVEPKSDTRNAPGSTTGTNRSPRTADELIDRFLTVLGDHYMPNGPSTYLDLDLRVLCAGCHMRTVEEGLEESVQKPIALLDDRCRLANNQLTLEGHKRANPGLLNATQLLVELKKKRHECEGEPNAYRRLIYITNPDCWAIMVLASTASSVQALYLTEFFYKYLGSKTFLGIHRPPGGVLSFALEFHLQFYVWREEDTLRQDPRKKRNNKPLRRSFQLRYLDVERQEGSSPVCIYEAQMSCLVAGLDHQFWTGYLFIDTYYQEDSSPESVEWYNSQEAIKMDPLAAGTIDSNLPTWTPREYFLIVYECRLKQVKHALRNLVSRLLLKLEPYIQDSMTLVPSPAEDRCSSPTQKKRIQQILNEAGRVLRQTIHSICKSIEGWDRFRNRDAQYLSDILRPKGAKTEPVPPFRVVAMIEEHVDGLRDLQHRAEQQQELCAGLARELEMELVMEDNEITAQQQATGELLKSLGVIGALFLPITAAAALFSMRSGVLPDSFFTQTSFLLCWLLPTGVVIIAGVYYNRKSFRLTRSRRQGTSLQDRLYSLQMRGWYVESTRSLIPRGADTSYRDDIELGPVSNPTSFID